jgi:transcription-repair coupling factor (superfamily II helicase)
MFSPQEPPLVSDLQTTQADRQKAKEAASAKAMSELLHALKIGDKAIGVAGLVGSSRALVVSRLVQAKHRPIVLVTPDEGRADELERDLRFFLGADESETEPRLLRIPADEILPYDDLSPDLAVTQQRLRSLFHLNVGTKVEVIILSGRSLARRVVPTKAVDAKALILAVDQDIATDELRKSLVLAGYENVPLVEDPGTFAMRGGIVDVFSPVYTKPARIEFFGDTIESIRFFDPETQRTTGETKELSVCVAREILFDDESKNAAMNAIRHVADEVNRPTAKVRELLDEVAEGVPTFGLEALLPGFYPAGLVPVWNYLPKNALVVLDDALELQREADTLDTDLARDFKAARDRGELAIEPKQHFLSADEVLEWLAQQRRIEFQSLVLGGVALSPDPDDLNIDEEDENIPSALKRAAGGVGTAPLKAQFYLEETSKIRQEIMQHHGEEGALEPLWRRLSEWRQTGIAGIVACHTQGQAEKLRRMLLDRNVAARIVPGGLPPEPKSLYQVATYAHIIVGELTSGFVDRGNGYALITDADIFGERIERKTRRARAEQPFVAAFRDLKEGDLVVHVEHGIARYMGLTKLSMRGFQGDFLELQFGGADKLYLPVHRLRQIQKYVGGDPEKIKLDSLKSSTFEKRKKKVKEELLKMAAELLDLYAARKAHPGTAYGAPDAMYRQFEADFEFDETPDQIKAINETLEDMQKHEPMDRLICGDVGFGKTEIALRAAFKAVEDKKQVALVVPTTVLAAQHFHTFQKRMKDYPINVEMVSRFRDAKGIKETLKKLAAGQIDIVVGTHRLLSADVNFKDLGLVIIDEEHRFGVKHKEALKQYRKNVDVLTMTATPIPRTLHMSLSGIRDMSIIATPPTDRRAVRTFVTKFDPNVVKEAIEREMARGGQVYFLHNRVESIDELKQFVTELVPTARIGVGHGQMADGELEEVMTKFVERQYDVLICTTIIESGIDVPTANTMLVNRADTFGLAQLYQIRGRVGRSRERAYCYLFVPQGKQVTKDAKKRLQVLQQFTELGAGFHIASHDMEIRGAGNLLGPDQSGSIAAVGFDLYAEMMDEAVRELRGEPPREDIEPDVTLSVPAYIPEDYIPEVPQRLMFYKRLAQAGTDDELYDIIQEMQDRYGEVPKETENLRELMALKTQMRKLKLRAMESGPGRLVVTLGADAALDPVRMAQLVARSKEGLKLTPDMKLIYPLPAPAPGVEVDLLASAHKMMNALEGIRALH